METAAAQRYGLGSRIAGLATDLFLFILLLLFGLTLLNILIAIIVLVVGFFQEPALGSTMFLGEVEQAVVQSTNRHVTDSIDLVIAVVSAVAVGFAYWGFLRFRRKNLHLFGSSGFALFVSKRYLMAREGGRLVGLISGVSVLGVAVGTMALIVVISVMQGFDATLVKKFMGVFSHIQIKPDPRFFPENDLMSGEISRDLLERMAAKDFVIGVSPILEHQTIVQKSLQGVENYHFVMLRGIEPELERNVTEFIDYVVDGDAIPEGNEAVVGQELARRMNLRIGDEFYAFGKMVPTANSRTVKRSRLVVAGIFHSGLYDVDDKFIYTHISAIQDLLLVEGQVGTVHMKVDDPQRVYEYAMSLRDELPNGYGMLTWQMLNRAFFEALWIEKVAMFIILLLIVLVASFNIIGTLVMTVVQKTRDIGVLKSMGATRTSILQIFLYHGFLIGLIGTSLGVVWGLRLCQFVSNDIEKIFRLPGGVYGIDRLPVVIDPLLILFMAVCSLSICVLASVIPALQAARLNPVEALRYD